MTREYGWPSRLLALLLSELLISLPMASRNGTAQQETARAPAQTVPLRNYLDKPYLELFETAPKLQFSASEIKKQRDAFMQGRAACVKRFKEHAKNYDKQVSAAQKELKAKTAKIGQAQRKGLHCRIQNLDLLKSQAQLLAQSAIPTAYDNLNAKLAVIEKWPAAHAQIQQQLANGSFNQRRWGDVNDIGFRVIAAKQEDDIRTGEQAVREMKQTGLLPPDLPDKAIQDYVNQIAQNVARHSDLKIPLHVAVLQSREINAFALPGGYLFVERGLLEEADDESELAGVLAHEIAHDTARHGRKLMKQATIASILYQAAQVAAIVLTGGAASIGIAYAMQYGFYGLGMVLNLKLLGVSRDYELEADQLGVQYAWNTGYDPTGFTRFFDKMATRAGYVNSVSWFRTHPPFYQRMVQAQRETMLLPKKERLIVQTNGFEQMKKRLAPIAKQAEEDEAGKPTLKMREEGCEALSKLEYKPGQPIETLCASAQAKLP